MNMLPIRDVDALAVGDIIAYPNSKRMRYAVVSEIAGSTWIIVTYYEITYIPLRKPDLVDQRELREQYQYRAKTQYISLADRAVFRVRLDELGEQLAILGISQDQFNLLAEKRINLLGP